VMSSGSRRSSTEPSPSFQSDKFFIVSTSANFVPRILTKIMVRLCLDDLNLHTIGLRDGKVIHLETSEPVDTYCRTEDPRVRQALYNAYNRHVLVLIILWRRNQG
jgi:hypothetical protein